MGLDLGNRSRNESIVSPFPREKGTTKGLYLFLCVNGVEIK